MTSPQRYDDPFAKLADLGELGTDQKLFTDTRKLTQESTRDDAQPRENPREVPRKPTGPHTSAKTLVGKRRIPRGLPDRDAIQEFSFRLRDELKVKVQAEVPPTWQKELEDMAHQLDVGKLELYRYIIGLFLGRLEQANSS